jgi:ribosomal protein S18 acetylase RimI-like enzyme
MIEIIKAEEHHIPEIRKLWLEFIRFHQDIDSIFTPRDNAVSGFEEYHLRPILKSKDGLVLVALDRGRVAGYSLSEIKDTGGLKLEKTGYVDEVAVTADYRRHGIGEKMYAEILKWFHSKDIDRVELEVTAKNQVSYSFWKKHGFTDYKHTLFRQI